MIEDLFPILELVTDAASVYGIVFLRIGTMFMLLPGFGERSIPTRVRLALAFCFSLVVAPLAPIPSVAADLQSVVQLIFAETLNGALFGLLLRLFVLGLQTTGAIAAQSTSLSQMFGGSAGLDSQPALGAVLVLAGLTLAVVLGLHVKLVAYMLLSYQLQPVAQVLNGAHMYQLGVDTIARCFALGFSLAGPFMIAALIYNVTLGFINKAMPQLMVSFIGAPAVTFAGLVLLAVGGTVILQHWVRVLDLFMLDPGGTP